MFRLGLILFAVFLSIAASLPEDAAAGPFGIRERVAARRASRMERRSGDYGACSGSSASYGCSGAASGCSGTVTREVYQAPPVPTGTVRYVPYRAPTPVRTYQSAPVQTPSCPGGRCPTTSRDFFTGLDSLPPLKEEDSREMYASIEATFLLGK